MMVSTFRSIGIGYAISNITLDTTTLEVFLPEFNPEGDGAIDPFIFPLESEWMDSEGNIKKGKIRATNSVECEWLPGKSFHRRPPSVRRGERVEVFTMGDTGRFWWRETGLDDGLRRLDTIIIAISATREEDLEEDEDGFGGELDESNTYYIEFSTHSKKVMLVTNKSDGEPYAYDICLDTKEGTFSIMDDMDNYLKLTTEYDRWELTSALNTKMTMEPGMIDFNIEEESNVNITDGVISATNTEGSNIVMDGGTITMTSSEGSEVAINEGITATESGGAKAELTGGTIKLEAGGSSIELDGSNVIVTGTLIELN